MRLPVLLIGLVLICVLGALRLADPGPIASLRLAYFDALQQYSPRVSKTQPVRVVDIDEASLHVLGQWPWPRDRLALLTRRLADAGAAAIAFDVLFAEPDRLSPARLAANPAMARLLRDGISPDALLELDTDAQFAAAIAVTPVVLGAGRSGRSGNSPLPRRAEMAIIGESAADALPDFGQAAPLLRALAEAAKGIGAISVGPGNSGAVTRTVPLLWSTPEGPLPSLALEAVRVAIGEDGMVLWGSDSAPGTVTRISLGLYDIPVTGDGQLWLRARRADTSAYIPAHTLLGDDPLPDLRDAIVLVGTSAAGLMDLRTTAIGDTLPGVAVHAQAIEQILSGQHLRRTEFAGGLELTLFLSSGLLISAVMSLWGPTLSILAATLAAVAIAAASWIGFAGSGLLIDATFPLIGTFLMFSMLTLYRLFVTDRDARLIRRSFSHYVAPDVLRDIETGGHKIALGGIDQPVSVMFSDIRNFTRLSEALDAQGVVTLLNRLFAVLSDEIMEQRGTIDKFMGDSVMAFWNAPVPAHDHPLRACRAAIAMRAALARFNAVGHAPEIRMGIGLATGMACVGNMGSRDRFNYTAIGETVNAAARLEAACRHVDYDILARPSVRTAAPRFAWLSAGALAAKGTADRFEAAILVGDETVASSSAFGALAEAHAHLLTSIADRSDFTEALARCQSAALPFSGLPNFYSRLALRAEDLFPCGNGH